MSGQQTPLTKKKRGPAATGQGHVVGVRLHPPQLERLDAWIAEQPDTPARPEAVRRLLDQALPVAPRQPSAAPPYAPGDRVRHAKFGTGTVVGPVVAMEGPDPASPSGVRDAGWRVGVEWDEDERGDLNVADWALSPAGGDA